MVQTLALVKHFSDPKHGTVHAVDGVSIQAEPGKIFGLLGANGAGKSTLLRLLSTVLKPQSGTAQVAGYDVATHPDDVRKNIGFMSTSTALYGRLTAKEMLEYFAELYGISQGERAKRVQFVIEKLDIGSFADRLCDKLSTGQKQRVSIGRTILHDPPVLFFDEPTAGLDVLSSQTVLEFIEEMRDAGKTIIYCTHIMSEVERLCNHVAIIHNGKIRGEGTVEALKQQTHQDSLERAFLTLVSNGGGQS